MGWQANVDVQYVGEISEILNSYITSYVTKRDKGQMEDLWDVIDEMARSKHSKLKSLGNKMLQGQEVGIYEAYMKATSMEYTFRNVPLVDVTLGREGKRRGCVKTGKEFQVRNQCIKLLFKCFRICLKSPRTHTSTTSSPTTIPTVVLPWSTCHCIM